LVITLLLLLMATGIRANAAETVLRVALLRWFSQVSSVIVQAPDGATLAGDDGVEIARGPGTWRFTAVAGSVSFRRDTGGATTRGSRFRLDSGDECCPLAIVRPSRAKPARYRGGIEIRPVSGDARLLLVNIVPIESYLRGVVAVEIGEDAPAEALKAQAITARTHALKSRGRYRSAPYDVRDTSDTQVYGGIAAERPVSDVAVLESAGMVLAFDGRLIWGDYYDDCGGVTSPGTADGDYPPSIIDRPTGGGTDYCAHGASHAWIVAYTLTDLAKALPPSIKARTGAISGLTLADTDLSGRARRIRITGKDGTADATGGDLRRWIGYTRLRSTLFTLSMSDDGIVTFTGRGNGHGHGMCQAGAIGMASPPYSARCADILQHYYPGSQLIPYASLNVKDNGGTRH
jgi:stage II sporulation protein D